MVTEEDNTQLKTPVETNSERYGNDTSIAEVFDDHRHPKPAELQDAIVATGHLTETEAFAFVHGHLEGFPHLSSPDAADEVVQRQGFDSASHFVSVKKRAKRKIADAIWIFELIDAYRFPDFGDEARDQQTESRNSPDEGPGGR